MRNLTLALALACASHATMAAAQAAPSETDSGEIVVTAQKRAERLLEVPMSITALQGEVMANTGITSTINLAQASPGIVTVNNGFGFLPVIRGIQSTGTSPGDETNVAVYVDDVSIGTPIAGFFDLSDIERVEVLKGPQGTLYGRNATGGAIRIVTRKPSFDTSGSVSADYGFHYDELKANGYVTGKITDQLAGLVSATYRSGDGYIRGTAGNVGQTYGKPNNYMLRGKLLWQAASNFEAILSADTWRQRNDSVFISMVRNGGNPFPQIPGSVPNTPYTNAGSTEPYAKLDGWGTSLDMTWDAPGDITVRSISGYRHVDVHSQSDTDRTSLSRTSNQLAQRQDAFSQELTASGPADQTLAWIVGAYYLNSKASNPYFRQVTGDSPGGTPASNFTNHMKSEALAGFGELTLNLVDNLHITGGLRYSTETKTFHYQSLVIAGVPNTGTVTNAEKTWNSTTWRGVARYDLSNNANVYFSASTGFKSGVYNAYSPLNIPVNPEKVTAFELGAKARVGGINFTLAGFAYKYKDIQVSSYSFVNGVLQLTLSNAARAKMRGLEFTADGRLGSGFSFNAGLGWQPTSKYQAFTTAQVTVPLKPSEYAAPFDGVVARLVRPFDASGSRTVRTPKLTANLRLTYEAELLGGDFQGNVNTSYTSAFNWQPGNYSREKGYALVNFRLGWTKNNVTYSVYGNNIFAHPYLTDLVPNNAGDSLKFAPKQEFGVGIRYDF
jgi:iron complex outermembrane receptor protein